MTYARKRDFQKEIIAGIARYLCLSKDLLGRTKRKKKLEDEMYKHKEKIILLYEEIYHYKEKLCRVEEKLARIYSDDKKHDENEKIP